MFWVALPTARAETVTIAADVWCPYSCAEDGYMVEIAREIFKRNHIEIDYRVIPWKDALEKARNGEVDAVVGATHDDAPDFIYPTSLQGLSDMRFWTLESSTWSYSDITSFSGVTLGVVEDYAYSKELNQYVKDYTGDAKHIYTAKGANALDDNLQKLLSKQIDVIAEDDNVINYTISTKGGSYPIKSAGSPVRYEEASSNFLYIAFPPSNKKAHRYAAMIDKGMKELRESGELKKILDIYHVNDWYGITKK
jgi:polar amino acid transport system substrate-binding protein